MCRFVERRCATTWIAISVGSQAIVLTQGMGGRTSGEVYNDAKSLPPVVDAGTPLELVVHYHEGRRELPIVSLKNAA